MFLWKINPSVTTSRATSSNARPAGAFTKEAYKKGNKQNSFPVFIKGAGSQLSQPPL